MLAALAAILIVVWLVSFFALHVSSFLIHILLIFAIISLILHFMRGKSA